jgi:hypothetical protein
LSYELFLVAVPDGADVEEAGEALLVRLTRGHQRLSLAGAGREWAESLSRKLTAAEPDLVAAPPGSESLPGTIELRAASGLVVAIAERFLRFSVPFSHVGDAAAGAFRQVFALLTVAASATGWRSYDPQEGESVALDDAACESILEIYLSVMDQLRASRTAVG